MQAGSWKAWASVTVIAATQLSIAGYARYASEQVVLSDPACFGGWFGGAANILLLAVIVLWGPVLAVKSFRAGAQHPCVAPVLFLAVTTGIAIAISMQAALRCTV